MGDKSPKSKARGQKQKDAVKQDNASKAKTKQDRQGPNGIAQGKK
jgi:hypothetical protein